MKRKRGQIPSTVFVYATAAIIIAFILIFGYKSIGKIFDTASATETAKFKTDIKNIIIEDTNYGKSDYVEIAIPTGFEELCFVGTDNPNALSIQTKNRHPQAADVAESPNNVFLADDRGNIDAFTLQGFLLKSEAEKTLNDLCVKQESGLLTFRIQGKGDVAEIIAVS